jgi:hypothetical protein
MLTLVEPLIGLEERAEIEREMVRLASEDPKWTSAWFAGVMWEIVATLPPSDPWRRLAARLDLGALGGPQGNGQVRSLTSASVETYAAGDLDVPSTNGAVLPSGRAFGTWTSATDLVSPLDTVPIDEDRALLPYWKPLDPVSAALIGLASGDIDRLARTLRLLHVSLCSEPVAESEETFGPDEIVHTPSGRWLRLVGHSLRWLVARRRNYLETFDPWVVALGYTWSSEASHAAPDEGEGVSLSMLAQMWPSGIIPPGDYEIFRLD